MRPPVVEFRAALIKTTLLFFFCSYTHAHAQLVTTTITDTINNFDGTPFTGNLTIIGASFQAPGAVPVIGGSKTIHITKGALSTKLVPNDTGTPANTYYVLNFSSGLSKTCSVPTSSTPLTLDAAGCIDGTPAAVLDTLMLSQLQQGGASTGQALCWLGTHWGPGSCASGGSGSTVTSLQGLSSTITLSTATAALGWTVAGQVITLNLPTANGSTRGLLSAADWTTFNSKQPAIINYTTISSLTGYPSAFNPSAHASTHAAAGSDPVTVTESQVANLSSDLASKQDALANYSTISGLSGYPSAFSPSAHAATHASVGSDPVTIAESQVTSLISDLAAKQATLANYATISSLTGYPASFTPSTHAATHASAGSDPVAIAESQVASLVSDLAAKQATLVNYATIAGLTGYPASFTPSAHASTHASAGSDPITIAESQVTNLLSDLAAKQATLVNYTTISGLTGYPASFTPSTHAATHASGGSDPVTLAESQVANLTSDLSSKEPGLGNPGVSGYVLSSTTGGVRSWIPAAASSNGTQACSTSTCSVSLSGVTAIEVTISTNITSASLSGGTAGQIYSIAICQDSTGGRTWPQFSNVNGSMLIGTVASKCSVQSVLYTGSVYYAASEGIQNQ